MGLQIKQQYNTVDKMRIENAAIITNTRIQKYQEVLFKVIQINLRTYVKQMISQDICMIKFLLRNDNKGFEVKIKYY